MRSPLTVRSRTVSGLAVVEAAGEVDVATAARLRTELLDVLSGGGLPPERVIVDLSAVTFVDSSGLGVLVAAHRRAEGAGVGFAVVTERRATLRLLRISGLHKILPVYPTVAEAAGRSDHD